MAKNVVDEPSEAVVAEARKDREALRNPFSRFALFIRQVFAELRKVIAPTRSELLRFTIVVLIFVIIIMALVYGLDMFFSWLVLQVFGQTGA